MSLLVKKFTDIRITDVDSVGGKNASLGEMYSQLTSKGIKVPDGFATTAYAFRCFLEYNRIGDKLKSLIDALDKKNFRNLKETGEKARELILNSRMPRSLVLSLAGAYVELCNNQNIQVAVRSSATAEDLPQASFAGQHESYLNITGETELIEAVQKCFASLYTDRAIKYREDNHFEHEKVALSVGVQKMVRSDKASSGVCFTLEPESGFKDVVHISGVWGLGENMVQGTVNPDEFLVFKPTLLRNKNAILQKKLGSKSMTMIYTQDRENPVINTDTPVVPEVASYRPIKTITFATDLDVEIDEEHYDPLIELAKKYESFIQIVNVRKDERGINDKQFIQKIRAYLTFDKIKNSFISVKNKNIIKGISNFIEKNGSDVLVMLAQKHSIFERMIGRIYTKEMSYATTIPLLVLQNK